MQFPIYFNVRNTQVISTGQLLGHQSTLIPVQNLGEKKISSDNRIRWQKIYYIAIK